MTNEFYRLKAQECLSKLRQAQQLIPHNPSRGYVGEAILRDFLKNALPSCAKVTQGFIIDGDAISPQCDIIIYDHINYAPIYSFGDVDLIPIESVYCVIEVKTNINRTSFNKVLVDFKKLNDMGILNKALFIYKRCSPQTIESYFFPRQTQKIELSFSNGVELLYDMDGYHALPDIVVSLISDIYYEKGQVQDENNDYYGYNYYKTTDEADKYISCLQKTLCYLIDIISPERNVIFKQMLNSQKDLEYRSGIPITRL